MSKIPVAKKGFRSWLSASEGKSSRGVLYEQKYQNHHDRIRNKENMSEKTEQSSSSFVSMVNPQPTTEDYEKYDADRRIKEKARDIRVAQRSASSSARNSLSQTPEPKETSPSSDQYFTPKRGSGDGSEEEFVTPSTSKKENRKQYRPSGSQNATPVSSKPPRHRSSDEHAYYTTCLSRKMEENFTRMQGFVFSGHSVKEARERALAETTVGTTGSYRSPRPASRRSSEENTVIVDRSSSQPPPIETLNSLPRVSRNGSPGPSRVTETASIRTSYVDTLVATHQMHLQYSDRVVVSVEKQMTKLESMKLLQNLAALSPAAKEAKRRRMVAENLPKDVETTEQTEKKLAVVRDLKERILKITNVQLATHQLVSSRPFQGDPCNDRLLKSLDHWVSLPFHEFDVQTARELQALHTKMVVTIDKFRNVASLHRKSSNRSFNTSRKSIAMRIIPCDLSAAGSSSDSPRHPASEQTREVATQVTARLADVAMTQTSPRQVGVEPLDLSSLEKTHSSSQTTPPGAQASFSTEGASLLTAPAATPVLNSFDGATTAIPFSITTMVDIDDMLNNIQLHNDSLETIDSFSHFKSDISYPPSSPAPSAESTPRSERVSLDSESARRLSAGVSQFLEKIKKENEEKNDTPRAELVQNQPISKSPPNIQLNSPSTVENSEDSHENQSPPLNDESEVELNVDEHDATQFEHEMEEQEEQRKLRENAVTPTPPIKLEQDTASEPFSQMISYIAPEDDEDETKEFVNSDEFERSLEDETSGPPGVEWPNDSADDSGFLLDSKPAPRLKSIFDNFSESPSSDLRADTPRVSDQANETTFGNLDMEEYCQNDFLNEIGPVMVHKAIEFQNELRGLDWITAQDVWKPPSFEEIHMDFYDHFDYFDSYSILVWGAVVDLINLNYLKFGRKLTDSEERTFEMEALDMLQTKFGPASKKEEWSKEVNMSKKLVGMMPYDLDYRYDVRRGIPDSEKQKYQWQQLQMTVIADRYPRKQLRDELDEVYNSEKENLGQVIIATELEQILSPVEEKPTSFDSTDKVAGVSDV